MPANAFRIVTVWHIAAPAAEIAAVLTDTAAFPRWWGRVYLATDLLAPGNRNRIGRRVAVHSRGWLPYTIRWTGELVAADLPHRWAIRATGDLNGRGVWQLEEQGAETRVSYDWTVTADRPLFRWLSPVLAPLFAWNHRWAMAQGAAALPGEIARRRGAASGGASHRTTTDPCTTGRPLAAPGGELGQGCHVPRVFWLARANRSRMFPICSRLCHGLCRTFRHHQLHLPDRRLAPRGDDAPGGGAWAGRTGGGR